MFAIPNLIIFHYKTFVFPFCFFTRKQHYLISIHLKAKNMDGNVSQNCWVIQVQKQGCDIADSFCPRHFLSSTQITSLLHLSFLLFVQFLHKSSHAYQGLYSSVISVIQGFTVLRGCCHIAVVCKIESWPYLCRRK